MRARGIGISIVSLFVWAFVALLEGAGCSHEAAVDREPASRVEPAADPAVIEVGHLEPFALAKSELRAVPNEVHVNGVVAPDVNRTVRVTSLAGGKLVEVRTRLGDAVEQGQLLLVIHSADLSGAIADYRKSLDDQRLADKALRRARVLFEARALALKDLQQAENDAAKTAIDVQTAADRIRLLGGDLDHLSPLIELRAPIGGTVVAQNATSGEAVKSTDNSPELLTIADLSRVWVLCDVYENNLSDVGVGDEAEVRLVAYPDRPLSGTVSNIARVLDPATRTAKVRIELDNAEGVLRPGMFATATFVSRQTQLRTVAPASAILRLQDRSWVFRAEAADRVRRTEVQVGRVLPDGAQVILGGLNAGDGVVLDALQFANAAARS
jgi:membrane fusion protein, heavy metal efflux system